MRNRPALGRGSSWFDGPGARPILGEPGPSKTAAAKASPPRDDPAFSGSRGVGGGYSPHHPRIGNTPPAARPPHSAPAQQPPVIKRVGGKANVSSACGPCKRAHLACDVARPCKRCVNIGKEDQCEDVPHKKRGRPKVNKTPSVDPYARPPRPSSSSMEESKWRPPPQYDSPYMTSATSPPVHLGPVVQRIPSPPRPGMMPQLGPYDSSAAGPYSAPPMGPVSAPSSAHTSAPGSSEENFVFFCSTELKIIRASADCYKHLGYHAHEFANFSLLDYIHPGDRFVVEQDRYSLVNASYPSIHPQSSRDTHAAVVAASERELLSVANGSDLYPASDVRMLHSDGGFTYFNVRQHLGGGLGGSLYQPESLGKIYLVISCLPFSDPSQEPHGRRHHHPSAPAAQQQSAALPSFSSIAAAADAPTASPSHYNTYNRPSSGPAPSQYYSRPTTSSSSTYPTAPSGPSPRAPSPAGQAPYPPSRYHSYPPLPPQHSPQGGYYHPPQGSHYDRRPDGHPDEWRRHGHPLPPPGAPGSAPPPADYRRGWDRQ